MMSNEKLNTQVKDLKANHCGHKQEIEDLIKKNKDLESELEESQDARQSLKIEFDRIMEKFSQLEKELHESKCMQLELIDTVSLLEQSIDDYKIQIIHFED